MPGPGTLITRPLVERAARDRGGVEPSARRDADHQAAAANLGDAVERLQAVA